MSLRPHPGNADQRASREERKDNAWFVLCDGTDCQTSLEVKVRIPVLAFYEATLHNGWRPGARSKPGVYCPACVEVGVDQP
jgi:hypothetical protein